MGDRKAKTSASDSKSSAGRRHEDDGPTLPYARAFLVQFNAETHASLRQAAGRVEHLASGARFRFGSISALHACITAMLANSSTATETRHLPETASGSAELPARKHRRARDMRSSHLR
jgi:hypothetical protein